MEIWTSDFRAKRTHFYLRFVFSTWKDLKCHWFVSSFSKPFCDAFQGHYSVYNAWSVFFRSCFRTMYFSRLNLIPSLKLVRLEGIGIAQLVLLLCSWISFRFPVQDDIVTSSSIAHPQFRQLLSRLQRRNHCLEKVLLVYMNR